MQRDDVYLFDIFDSAKAALEYLSGKSRSEFLWETVQTDLPALIAYLEPLLPNWEEPENDSF